MEPRLYVVLLIIAHCTLIALANIAVLLSRPR